jgi:prepilin-type N-terminal cleavage/methylation domain-containing protein
MRRRFLKDQSGFTLTEVMVTMMIMLVVLFSLYNIFDMSIKVFTFGNDKIEAVENARVGLEKMEREIRAAYTVKGPGSTDADRYRFFAADGTKTNVPPSLPPTPAMPTATQITFGNELGTANGAIQCGSPCEYITYKLTANNSGSACTGAPCALRRVNTANASNTGQPVVEYVAVDGLQFKYYTASGATATEQENISRVEISLQIIKDGRIQNVVTEVNLRNPGSI